ncbi:MAG: TIGR02466 family protein [Parvularculaceae bacterium]
MTAEALAFDLHGGSLALDNTWVNVFDPDGFHSGHSHPHCAISGTYYARTPEGAAALKFEDPRLTHMMAAPMRPTRCAASPT